MKKTLKVLFFLFSVFIFVVYFICFYVLAGVVNKAKAQDFSVVLSEYQTTYAYKLEEKKNRAANVELAASKINDFVLKPDEIFSFNKTVGPRTERNGFLTAPEIIKGKMTEGVGGGVCQVSSTVHAAMLHAGMIIIEAKQHSRHSVYIGFGLDSTVSWGNLDLKILNNYPFPVKISVETKRDKKRGYLTVKILGEKKYYNTEIVNVIHKKEKFKTKKIIRKDLQKGFIKTVEPGTNLVYMTRVRRIYKIDLGNSLTLEEELNIRYNKSDRILVVGVGP